MAIISGFLLSLIGGVWSRIGPTLLKWGSILLLILGAVLYVRRSGRIASELEAERQGMVAIKARKRIDRELQHAPDSELNEWLLPPDQRGSRSKERSE